MTIAIDFETYYDDEVSITTLGTHNYLAHPKCEPYLVSVASDHGANVFEGVQSSRPMGDHAVAHNASFDQRVAESLSWLPMKWDCTADLAAYLRAPRNLAGAARHLLGESVSKAARDGMKGVTWEEAKAKGWEQKMKDYARRDAELCYRLWNEHSHKWPEHERKLSRQTRALQDPDRGVLVDQEALAAGIEKVSQVRENALNALPWGEEDKPLSLDHVRRQCELDGIKPPPSLAKDSPECDAWLDSNPGVSWVEPLRTFRSANMFLSKLEALQRRVLPNGHVPVALKYFGGHTGRWSGDNGVNFQNLPRGEMFGVDFRKLLKPLPGHTFLIADLSQIEPRVLAWLTKDRAFLDSCRRGVPLYEAHARATMGWNGGDLKSEDPSRYALAKARVLALGYGCGHKKFVHMAKTLLGMELDETQAQKIVDDFRSTSPRLTKLWNNLDEGFRASVGSNFEVTLPSGRDMVYYNVFRHGRYGNDFGCTQTLGGKEVTLWGGAITENIVQAAARDVFADRLLALEEAGFNIAFHVHDEVILHVPKNTVDSVTREVHRIFTTAPEWMGDLPLASSIETSDYYTK